MGRREVCEAIAGNLRRLRLDRGFSQEALAEAVGADIRTIQRLEAADTNPTIGLLADLADALDVDLRELFEPAKLGRGKRGRPRGT